MIDDLTALRLQLEWGADENLGDTPIDRFRPAPPAARQESPPATPAAFHPAVAAPAAALAELDTLDAWHAALDRLSTCPLRATATHTVRPSGSPAAPIVFVSEAPDSDDDRSGRAFSGAAGALLDRVIASVGLHRDQMLLATLVPWRPPGNRPPSDSEIAACLPYLHRLLALVRPRLVVLAGGSPATTLTGQTGTIRQLRGRWIELAVAETQLKVPALPILPPSQWLRDAGTKQQLWSDLLQLRDAAKTG